jgi:hypothetical protein
VSKHVAPKSVAVNYAKGPPVSSSAACLLEDSQKISLRDTLERIKGDVERCLKWLDSDFPFVGFWVQHPSPFLKPPILVLVAH